MKTNQNHADKYASEGEKAVNEALSEETQLTSEAAVNVSEYGSREHANHMTIDDMRE